VASKTRVRTIMWFTMAVLVAALGIGMGAMPQSRGDTLNYPWPTAPCAFGGAGGAHCTNPADSGDSYDWYWDENGNGRLDGSCSTRPYSGECFDQWGYEYRNCTSYVAWRLSRNGYTMPFGIGNANAWDDYFRNHNVTVNDSPAVGAIAQTDAGGFGHVAYVESYTTTTVTVSEYNRDTSSNGDTRTVSLRTFNYIHVKDQAGSGGSASAGTAFQANTGNLWTSGAAGTGDHRLGMMAATSPSIAAVPGGYQIAFQANTGNLWVTGALGTRDLGLGMKAGTSPSIAAVPGGYEVAFQANTGNLWVAGTQGTGDLRLGMMAGTSPSIASCNGNYGVAFQANTGNLWTTGAAGTGDRGLGMMGGTSPSMACASNGFGVAFQANTGNLWTFGAAGTGDRGLGMMARTSPSIAAGAGGFGVAFQANTGNLWTTGAAGTGDRGLGMMGGTSPSIAGGSSYNVAFQANTGNLWTTGAAGTGDRGLGMMGGTSPSIA
jgi:surface antigen